MGQRKKDEVAELEVVLRPWRELCTRMFLAVIHDARQKYPTNELIDMFIVRDGDYFADCFRHRLGFNEIQEILAECRRSGLVKRIPMPQPRWLLWRKRKKKKHFITTLALTEKGKEFAGNALA